MVRGRKNPGFLSFPSRLRKARKATGYTRQGVTQQASLAGQSTIVDWENGQRIPRIDTVEKVAYALGLSPAFLAFGLATESSQPTQGLRSEGIASRVRETRTARGLSVLALATAAALSHTAVGNVERGTMPTLATAEGLAIALGVSPGWLAYGLGPMELPGRRNARRLESRPPSDESSAANRP